MLKVPILNCTIENIEVLASELFFVFAFVLALVILLNFFFLIAYTIGKVMC